MEAAKTILCGNCVFHRLKQRNHKDFIFTNKIRQSFRIPQKHASVAKKFSHSNSNNTTATTTTTITNHNNSQDNYVFGDDDDKDNGDNDINDSYNTNNNNIKIPMMLNIIMTLFLGQC